MNGRVIKGHHESVHFCKSRKLSDKIQLNNGTEREREVATNTAFTKILHKF